MKRSGTLATLLMHIRLSTPLILPRAPTECCNTDDVIVIIIIVVTSSTGTNPDHSFRQELDDVGRRMVSFVISQHVAFVAGVGAGFPGHESEHPTAERHARL